MSMTISHPSGQLIVNFADQNDVEEFARVIGQEISEKVKSIWFPEAEIGTYKEKRYVTDDLAGGLGEA